MQVTRLFPRTLEDGEYLENVCNFAARRCRTLKTHNQLWDEVIGWTPQKRSSFFGQVVHQDWALDVLELTHLVLDWEGVPLWLIIELLRHRFIARDFSLEQLSQRAITASEMQILAPDWMQPHIRNYLDAIQADPEFSDTPPEDLRAGFFQGTLVNLVVAGNVRSWQHVFNMRAPKIAGGRGGAHPLFQELAMASFESAREVYPLALSQGIIPA
mgnify:CR=1 FL=1